MEKQFYIDNLDNMFVGYMKLIESLQDLMKKEPDEEDLIQGQIYAYMNAAASIYNIIQGKYWNDPDIFSKEEDRNGDEE